MQSCDLVGTQHFWNETFLYSFPYENVYLFLNKTNVCQLTIKKTHLTNIQKNFRPAVHVIASQNYYLITGLNRKKNGLPPKWLGV